MSTVLHFVTCCSRLTFDGPEVLFEINDKITRVPDVAGVLEAGSGYSGHDRLVVCRYKLNLRCVSVQNG